MKHLTLYCRFCLSNVASNFLLRCNFPPLTQCTLLLPFHNIKRKKNEKERKGRRQEERKKMASTVTSRNHGTKYRTLKRNNDDKKSLKSLARYTPLELKLGSLMGCVCNRQSAGTLLYMHTSVSQHLSLSITLYIAVKLRVYVHPQTEFTLFFTLLHASQVPLRPADKQCRPRKSFSYLTCC